MLRSARQGGERWFVDNLTQLGGVFLKLLLCSERMNYLPSTASRLCKTPPFSPRIQLQKPTEYIGLRIRLELLDMAAIHMRLARTAPELRFLMGQPPVTSSRPQAWIALIGVLGGYKEPFRPTTFTAS